MVEWREGRMVIDGWAANLVLLVLILVLLSGWIWGSYQWGERDDWKCRAQKAEADNKLARACWDKGRMVWIGHSGACRWASCADPRATPRHEVPEVYRKAFGEEGER